MIAGLPYFGSKGKILEWTLSFLPRDTQQLLDVFGGSGLVTMNAPHYTGRIYNDISHEVTTLLHVIQTRPDELHELLLMTPYHRGFYKNAIEQLTLHKNGHHKLDELRLAQLVFVAFCQSRTGGGQKKGGYQWAYSIRESRRRRTAIVSKWHNKIALIPQLHEALFGVQYECEDFRTLLNRYRSDTFTYYIDSPYYLGDRASQTLRYEYEFSETDHVDLARLAHELPGRVLVAGYPGRYDQLYSSWHRETIEFVVGKRTVTDCLWMNNTMRNAWHNELQKRQRQPKLF